MRTLVDDVNFGDDLFWNECVESLRLGAWKLDLRTEEVLWSRVTREIHGVDDAYQPVIDEAINFYSTKEPGRKAITSAIKHTRETGAPWDLECRFVSATGQEMWVRTLGYAIRDEAGEVVALKGVFQDISDYKGALSAVIQYETDLKQQKDALDEHAIVSIGDTLGGILYVNKKFCEVSGYSSEELLGQNHRIVSSGQHDKSFWESFWGTLERGETFQGEICNRKKDGSLYWVDSSIVPHFDNHGKIDRYISIRTDITKRKLAEEQQRALEKNIQQMQKMEAIGQLVGGIAHDFNNILAAILGYTEICLLDTTDENVKKGLKKVQEAGHRATNLVNQILTFSRQSEVAPQPVNIRQILQEALKLLRATLPSSIEIRQNIQSDSSTVADPTQMHQVIMNLCSNGGHAMEISGGVLSVDLVEIDSASVPTSVANGSNTSRFIKLIVADTGTGMTEEIASRVFDPFFTTKEIGRGTGMGLSIVHGIISRYHGSIHLETAIGKGTTVTVFFPIVEEAEQIEVDEDKQLTVGEERILFIDDEEVQTEFSKDLLERLGYSVETETSSKNALAIFKDNPGAFDIVITDMTMPNLSGDELSREILSIRPDIPIILCTGYSQKISKTKALEMGIKGFIHKPFSIEQMAQAIRHALLN